MAKEETARLRVAVLIRDLIFETKIRATARSLNVDVWILRGPTELSGLSKEPKPQLLIVDLGIGEGEAIEAIRAAKSTGLHVVAFVSHVDVELADRAEKAGADVVLPRSRFAAQLPSNLLGGGESVE